MDHASIFVKLRPLTTKEKEKNVSKGAKVVEGKLIVGPENDSLPYPFPAFGADVSSADFYTGTCSSIVQKGLTEGVNVALLCVGESKSGKSTTLGNGGSTGGLVPRAALQLFDVLDKSDCFVGVSYLNVFNEKMTDILNPCDKDMKIKSHPKLGVYIEGLSELAVRDANDLQRLYDQGNKVRKIMEVEMDTPSSKSHTLFIVFTERKEKDGSIKRCKIQFYNIAGLNLSGDDKVGNSLRAFDNVISGAAEAVSEPQYNSSKLTKLLSGVLGKGSLTAFIAHCSPTESSITATKSTLSLLSKAQHILVDPTPVVFDLAKMIADLRKKVAVARDAITTATSTVPKEHLAELDASLAALTAAKGLQWASREKESVRGEEERRHTLADQGVLEWITDSHSKVQAGGKVLVLQTEKDRAVAEYKKQKGTVDSLKTELQASINQHTIAAESHSEVDAQESLAKIHLLRDKLKGAKDKDRELKKVVKEAQDKLKFERSVEKGEDKEVQSNFELSYMVSRDELTHLKRDNAQFLAEEKERFQSEAEQEMSEAKLSATQGQSLTMEQCLTLQERIAQQTSANHYLSLNIQCLQAEVEKSGQSMEGLRGAYKAEAETTKMQNLRTFRQYKDFHEESRTAMEAKYQELLNECVQDCVFLSARNTELADECSELKRKLKHYER